MAFAMVAAALCAGLGASSASAAAGDFSIDFVAAAPDTYDHLAGGGAFNDRTIGEDVVESLNGGDFVCGDIVTFLPRVTVEEDAQDAQTIEMRFSFGASTASGGEVGFSEVVGVQINDGDAGTSQVGSAASVTSSQVAPAVPFTGALLATVELAGLDPSDAVVVRIDVRLDCGTGPATGVVQSQIDAAVNTVPAGGGDIGVGMQTIPLMSPSDVLVPGLSVDKELSGNADEDASGSVTVGDTLTYTITATNTGEVALSEVTVTDSLIEGLSCTPSLPASLAVGASVVCEGTYVVAAADIPDGVVVNTATAASERTPPVEDTVTTPVSLTPPPTDVTGPPSTTTPPAATIPPATATAPPARPTSTPRSRLRVTKIGPRRLRGGGSAVYRIVVRNVSRVTARNVRILDALPRGVVLRAKPPRSRVGGRRIRWRTIPRIAPGRRVVRIVRVRVLAGARGRRCNNVVATARNASRVRARTCARAIPRRTRVIPAVTG